MRTNTGGQLPNEYVVGRDKLIARIWKTLETQSCTLHAARRIGKTSITKKMNAETLHGFWSVYRDVEGLRSPIEFVSTVYEDAQPFLTRNHKIFHNVNEFLHQLSGIQVASVKIPDIAQTHWKSLLEKIALDLSASEDVIPVFFWDEIPMMIENIRQDKGASVAMELLDTLRAIRQNHPRIRMVYTGSIGMHHVVNTLKASGYTNAPQNDMKSIAVPPLDDAFAVELAGSLLLGEKIDVSDLTTTAAAIAKGAGNIPFYIHHIVDSMTELDTPASASNVESIIVNALTSPNNPWEMTHYRDRINQYFGENIQLALNILDVLAATVEPLTAEQVRSRLSAEPTSDLREAVLQTLRLLRDDHYVRMNEDGHFNFAMPLVKRWWMINRGSA